jgi:integrase
VLQASLNYVHREGLLVYAPAVTLTDHSAPRERWLTRDEAARLLREARRSGNRTLVRFILIGLYTGTRPGAILKLRWVPSLDSGWVDLDRGILHRAGAAERQTVKRRGDCRIPRQLLAHMRRWRGGGLVISWKGKRVADIGKAFATACRRAGIEAATPHTLKHTAVTWAFQRGMAMEDAVGFFSTSAATLERVYRQHSPLHQRRAVEIMERKR